MICPKCKSNNTVKAGKAIRKGGMVQTQQCKDCGYRAPEIKFEILPESKPESSEE